MLSDLVHFSAVRIAPCYDEWHVLSVLCMNIVDLHINTMSQNILSRSTSLNAGGLEEETELIASPPRGMF